jgi:ssDNA thymidine ADP-ribosyltransferase, DarT
VINKDRKYCYRITHIQNLPLILENGIVTKNHRDADGNYIEIGNPEIIDVRSTTPVRIDGYGMIGEYVPFYFTPKAMMLYNIITGYRAPVVPKRNRNEILVIRCLITDLTKLKKWFFTDGQANIKDGTVKHYNNLDHLDEIDWESIQESNFSKSDGDYDRPRRYQAEFLVHGKVPLKAIESLNVYNQHAADYVNEVLNENNINLAVNIQPQYFF